jgi:hypothetical protein
VDTHLSGIRTRNPSVRAVKDGTYYTRIRLEILRKTWKIFVTCSITAEVLACDSFLYLITDMSHINFIYIYEVITN